MHCVAFSTIGTAAQASLSDTILGAAFANPSAIVNIKA